MAERNLTVDHRPHPLVVHVSRESSVAVMTHRCGALLLAAAAVAALPPTPLHGTHANRIPTHATKTNVPRLISGCDGGATGAGAIVDPAVVTMDLGGAMWELSNANGSIVVPAEVPGVVHLDLLRAGRVPEPYYRSVRDFSMLVH